MGHWQTKKEEDAALVETATRSATAESGGNVGKAEGIEGNGNDDKRRQKENHERVAA
jgi:hypothetical protein